MNFIGCEFIIILFFACGFQIINKGVILNQSADMRFTFCFIRKKQRFFPCNPPVK